MIAALLHDAIEDQNIRGRRSVASLVKASQRSSASDCNRQRAEQVGASQAQAEKLSNVRSPPSHWPAQRQLDYVACARDVVTALGDNVNENLQSAFATAAGAAEKAARAAMEAASQ